MRGLFSAGVTDAMMEAGLKPDGIVGVSAGAAFGCNYKSGQPGRAIRYNKRFARDRRYCGLKSLLTSGDMFNAEFAYHVVPTEYDVFDSDAFERNPMQYIVVCTDVHTGEPVYIDCREGGHKFFEVIRASASMPVVSRIVNIDGRMLLDGGMSDSIPLEYMERSGYERNVVVLTQPKGYRKKPSKALPVIRLKYRRYKGVVDTMSRRHDMYNAQLDYVAQAEAAGRCLVIRPEAPIPIGHISHSPEEMQGAYDMGLAIGRKYVERIKRFWNQ